VRKSAFQRPTARNDPGAALAGQRAVLFLDTLPYNAHATTIDAPEHFSVDR